MTQTFFGAELKEKKRRRGEEEASRAVEVKDKKDGRYGRMPQKSIGDLL